MKPYYQDSAVTIYHGDCREILPTLPKVDLVLTDPPYGIGYKSGYSDNFEKIVGDDGTLDVVGCIKQTLGCLLNGKHLYVFGRWDLAGLPIGPSAELVWDKEKFGMGNLELPWGPQHEIITFAVHLTRPAARKAERGGLTARMRRGSVLRSLRPNAARVNRHPTEKPVDILRQMIESSSLFGNTALDPFMGSGSTLEAAKLEGRKAIGIEIEEKYCEIAAQRMAQEVLDL